MDVRARQRLPEGSTPGALLGALRTHRPLVHCITNRIANTYTANALLALGASPCMVDQPGQAEQFVTSADALLINTASAPGERVRSSLRTAWTASRTGVRWVLDPVGYGTIPAEDFADALLGFTPAIVRGNATEVLALAGRAHGGQGVDATDDPEQAAAPALSLASRLGAVVAVSGGVDVLTDGTRTRRVHNSSAMLPRVTGSGCALGGLMAAFLSVSADPLDAAVAATAVLTVAGERAEARTPGPGSFAAALLDELYALSPDRLDEEARLS